MAQEQIAEPNAARRRGRLKLLVLLLVCAAPIIVSYITFYIVKPDGRTNYSTILDARTLPIPEMTTTTLDGKPRTLADLKGKWIMVRVGGGACDEECGRQLYAMRQWRTMQGKNMDRMERVWLITDNEPLDTVLMREYDGMELLRAPAATVAQWLPVEAGRQASDHIYLIDPLGNLMMRFPYQPEPGRVYKDIAKLLKASAIG
ncbi:cytochrome C oxidase subunit I [Massilia sp. HP4]|uniref:SCO family protein n=1 Tax=Massilia sp. HP4 TaxID=2562316 RepID=UPI001E2E02C9|nr:cytochrome C oxidase subunit I [Massilia sp. HP4]